MWVCTLLGKFPVETGNLFTTFLLYRSKKALVLSLLQVEYILGFGAAVVIVLTIIIILILYLILQCR